MRVGFFFKCGQGFFLLGMILMAAFFIGCRRSSEEIPVLPPVNHPLAREYIGYGVVNVSFTHLLNEPGASGVSRSYLRRGTVICIIERRQIINRGNAESWVLAEGSQSSGVSAQGWLNEATVDIFDNESRAITASKAMNL